MKSFFYKNNKCRGFFLDVIRFDDGMNSLMFPTGKIMHICRVDMYRVFYYLDKLNLIVKVCLNFFVKNYWNRVIGIDFFNDFYVDYLYVLDRRDKKNEVDNYDIVYVWLL